MPTELESAIGELRLVDHHVHASLRDQPTTPQFAQLLTESAWPAAPGTSHLDSQIGIAVRRHCAPLLGLEPHCAMEDYLDARRALSAAALDDRLLAAAGVDRWLVDTGYQGSDLLTLDEFTVRAPGRVEEIVRLETVLETVALGASAQELPDLFRLALTTATTHAVGLKSVIAYRYGFDVDPARPSEAEVKKAAGRWLREIDAGASPRVTNPVLLRFLLWEGLELGLPLQMHAGYGDPDLDLHRCDPLLLTSWLRAVESRGVAIVLLHCYPYHRHAGYLAQVFPHVYFDVGLAVNYTGAASSRVVAESLELAPFGKIFYSSDAWGPAELHHLGSVLWRRGLHRTLSAWVEEGEWSSRDALRVATMIGKENAERVYGAGRD
ncbi:amidohydrolase family protein [Saccharopolyspora sp. NPDC000995]